MNKTLTEAEARQKIAAKVNQMMDESYGCAESFIAAAGEHLFGELDPAIKAKISHRARALKKIRKSLQKYLHS